MLVLGLKKPVRVDGRNDGLKSKKGVQRELNRAKGMMTVSKIKQVSQNYEAKSNTDEIINPNANKGEAVGVSSNEEDEEINESLKQKSNVVDLTQDEEMEEDEDMEIEEAEENENSDDEDWFELID